jgi:hypothetical protein
MADAELHIHINHPIKIEDLNKLIDAAMAANAPSAPEPQKVVPAGYRCEECWQNDGEHSIKCSIGRQA